MDEGTVIKGDGWDAIEARLLNKWMTPVLQQIPVFCADTRLVLRVLRAANSLTLILSRRRWARSVRRSHGGQPVRSLTYTGTGAFRGLP